MSIKDKVAIIGVGFTKFGENFDMSYEDMAVDAAHEAFEDAGIEPMDVQATWLGTEIPSTGNSEGRTGASLANYLDLSNGPVTRVANYCANSGWRNLGRLRSAHRAKECRSSHGIAMAIRPSTRR